MRPTASKVKEALFQMLGPALDGAAVLDLYAGGGNLGLEALSRGASHCLFVDRSGAACCAARANIERLDLGGAARVLRRDSIDALRALARRGERFDILLADPPYAKQGSPRSEFKMLLRALDGCDIFAADAVIVAEHYKSDRPDFPLARIELVKQKRYGDTLLSFFRLRRAGTSGEAKGEGI